MFFTVRIAGQIDAAKEDAARGRLRDRGDHLHQRRFPGAVRAEKTEHAAGDVEGEITDAVVASAEAFRDRFELQHARIYVRPLCLLLR